MQAEAITPAGPKFRIDLIGKGKQARAIKESEPTNPRISWTEKQVQETVYGVVLWTLRINIMTNSPPQSSYHVISARNNKLGDIGE